MKICIRALTKKYVLEKKNMYYRSHKLYNNCALMVAGFLSKTQKGQRFEE